MPTRTFTYTNKWKEKTRFILYVDDTVEIIHKLEGREKDVETIEGLSANALAHFTVFRSTTAVKMNFMEEPEPE